MERKMTDCINRKARLQLIGTKPFSPTSEREDRLINAFVSTVQNFPAADVREVKWIPFETRPMDEEERAYYSEHYGFELADEEAVIYCSQMPDHGQEVLVCNTYGNIWLDIFDDDPDYGVGFETNGDMDGLVAWMPLPKPYEPPNCGADMRGEQT